MGREGGRRQEGRGECWRGERRSEGGGKRGIEKKGRGEGERMPVCARPRARREREKRERERERERERGREKST